jgi:hypothetical protein
MNVASPVTIYVALKDEGTPVWRPVSAVEVAPSRFRIGGTIPEDELWEFQPGQIVECETHRFESGASGLIAVRAAV